MKKINFQYNLFDTLKIKIAKSIKRIQDFSCYCEEKGFYVAFSGGKDSVVLEQLVKMSGVKYTLNHSLTTIDPPELIYFIRNNYDIIIHRPKIPFLKRLIVKGFPLRQSRWCCEEYKENGGLNEFILTGIRWQESRSRRERCIYEQSKNKKNKTFLHPIIDWQEQDIWEFIRIYNLPYCKLYDKGFKRIGCLFCPMQYWKRRIREVKLYPKFAKLFIRAFEKLYEDRTYKFKAGLRKENSCERWENGKDMFWWWIKSANKKKKDENTIYMYDN